MTKFSTNGGGNPRIIGLSDPTQNDEAATKNYVDNNRANGGVINNIAALQPFWDALRTATATVVTIGDSITYGLFVNQNQSYPEVFNQNMISRYGGLATSWTDAGGSHLNGSNDASDSSRGFAFTGTPTVTARGLGAASVSLTHSGDSQTYTTPFACTEVRVWYKKGPSQGKLQITIDGGTPVAIDTGNATISWNNIWTTGTLSSAVHTVKVEPITGGSLNSGYSVEIGAYDVNPTAKGTRLYNASRSGAETKEFIQANNPHWEDSLSTINPQVFSIHLGTNDKYYGRTLASTKANFIEIIDTVNSKCSQPPAIVLYKLKLSPGYFNTVADVQPYWDMIDQIQALYPSQVVIVDLYKLFGNSGDNVNGMFPTAGLMGVHPGVRGHYALGNLLASTLLPPYSQSADTYLTGDIYANNITASNNITAVSLTTSKAINIGKNISDSKSITTSGKVVIGDTLNVTGGITAASFTGDLAGRTSTPVEEVTASISLAIAQLGKTLVYNGTSDITVTYDGSILSLASYVFPTSFVQLNTGKITIAVAGGFSVSGTASTGGAGQRLLVLIPATTVTKVFCTLLGAGQTSRSVNAQTGTSYTFVLGDKDAVVTASNGAAQTYTIPLSSSVAYPLGTQLTLAQIGTGAVTAVGASGVTVNGTSGGSIVSAQYQTIVLYKIATDTWQADIQTPTASSGSTAPRVNTLTVSGSTYTINTDTTDLAIISSPTANFTVATSGTPVDGQLVRLRIVNGATAYTPTWNTIFMSSGGVFLPSSYVASKTNLHLFEYVASKSKWVLMAFDSGF